MNLDLIRFTDKYLGVVLRILLYYFQKIRDLFPQPWSREPFKRILVVKFWGIGNIVRASPVFASIRERFPGARVTFITLSQNRGVYEDSGLFNEVIYLDLHSVPAFLWDVVKKFFLLRQKHFDLVLCLEPWANFSEIVSFYVGTRMRVGFTAPMRRSLFNVKVPFIENEHISRSFFRILQPFGMKMLKDLTPLPITVTVKDREYIKKLLAKEGITENDTFIAINVNASDVAGARRWDSENYARLSDLIVTKLGVKTVFIGGPGEMERVQSVIDLAENKGINLAGRTTLKQVIAALDFAQIFVTNDSGPMHLAMAMRTPTVALFGPETPERYGPVSDLHYPVFKDYDCSPCISFKRAKKIKCEFGAKCLTDITVEDVFNGVEILRNRIEKKSG